jgi:hypothetical protein
MVELVSPLSTTSFYSYTSAPNLAVDLQLSIKVFGTGGLRILNIRQSQKLLLRAAGLQLLQIIDFMLK